MKCQGGRTRSVVVSSGPGVTILPNAAERDLCPLRRSKEWQHSNSGIFDLGLSYMLMPVMEQINNLTSNRVTAFGISYKTSSYSTVAKKNPCTFTCEHCVKTALQPDTSYTQEYLGSSLEDQRVETGIHPAANGPDLHRWRIPTTTRRWRVFLKRLPEEKYSLDVKSTTACERIDFQNSTKIWSTEAKEMGIWSQSWRARIITKPRPREASAWRASVVTRKQHCPSSTVTEKSS